MLSQLLSITSVLDEPGVSFERALFAAICAGEGLLRVRYLIRFIIQP